jgi:hypothetical protein
MDPFVGPYMLSCFQSGWLVISDIPSGELSESIQLNSTILIPHRNFVAFDVESCLIVDSATQ